MTTSHKFKFTIETKKKELHRLEGLRREADIQWDIFMKKVKDGTADFAYAAGFMQKLNDIDLKIINIKFEMDYTLQMSQ